MCCVGVRALVQLQRSGRSLSVMDVSSSHCLTHQTQPVICKRSVGILSPEGANSLAAVIKVDVFIPVCRSCLVKYLEDNNTCPTCRIVIHQSHPLQYIGHDRTMQDIVYKLVPGLQEAEIKKQRDFYQKLGMEVPGDIKGELCNMKTHLDQRNGDAKSEETANKEAGEEKPEEDNDYHRSDEQTLRVRSRSSSALLRCHVVTADAPDEVSICLECNSSKLRGLKRKWIRCSAQATVLHLKKFIAKKLNLTSFNELDILCNEEILGKDHTLKFVVVTRWRFKSYVFQSVESPQCQSGTFGDSGDERAGTLLHQDLGRLVTTSYLTPGEGNGGFFHLTNRYYVVTVVFFTERDTPPPPHVDLHLQTDLHLQSLDLIRVLFVF
ncbi:hypothetical protein F2P81_008384 [Scophthalmus maximus]|uniref:RAWUL domain-containing protein n=1 Tax=Scophthalmus maximus TaxID=52904 RepID=A0A6A4T5E1_SCOMX|nr:hypothetical protein F2P81_008384 [Scophthalmus maximus]